MRKFLFLVVATTILLACNPFSQKNEVDLPAETLSGHWEVIGSKRNNNDTKALEGVFFDFGADKVKTNMPLDNEMEGEYESAYKVEDTKIILTDKSNQTFEIKQNDGSELVLLTNLLKQTFEIKLEKR